MTCSSGDRCAFCCTYVIPPPGGLGNAERCRGYLRVGFGTESKQIVSSVSQVVSGDAFRAPSASGHTRGSLRNGFLPRARLHALPIRRRLAPCLLQRRCLLPPRQVQGVFGRFWVTGRGEPRASVSSVICSSVPAPRLDFISAALSSISCPNLPGNPQLGGPVNGAYCKYSHAFYQYSRTL